MVRDYITDVPWIEAAIAVFLALLVFVYLHWIGRRGGRVH